VALEPVVSHKFVRHHVVIAECTKLKATWFECPWMS